MTAIRHRWPFPPPSIALAEEVHVWAVSLDVPAEVSETLEAALSEVERARARRFRFERDRRRYIAARGALRTLLGDYLGIPAAEIGLAVTEHGKPVLSMGADRAPLHFNVSHADDLALMAVAGVAIGVDVEAAREIPDAQEIAAQMFAAGERAALMALPETERDAAFLRCWTRKEAFIKARGEGLSCPLDGFEVTLAPGDPARFVSIDAAARDGRDWSLTDLSPAEGYVGALVTAELREPVRGWRWRPRGA